jgi:hypothetical protein
MTTFTDERLAWREIPTRSVFGTHGSGYHLERAGYMTLGDILSASEEDLISRVMGVGPVRAARIRQRALAIAQVATLDTAPVAEARPAGPRPLVVVLALALAVLVGFALAVAITQGG